jgi:hypothetical protein
MAPEPAPTAPSPRRPRRAGRLLVASAAGFVGVALACGLGWALFPRPAMTPEAIVASAARVEVVTRSAAPGVQAPEAPPPTRELPDPASLSARFVRRLAWASARAASAGGSVVLCDFGPVAARAEGLAALNEPFVRISDGEHDWLDGAIDPATSVMMHDRGWTTFVVYTAEGEAVIDGRRVRWEGAAPGEVGRCVAAAPIARDVTVRIRAVDADGAPIVDPPGVETWAWGCASEEPLPVDGGASSVPAGGCRLRAVSQRKNGLQVAYGPWVVVDAPAGSELDVALPTPPPPAWWSPPDFDRSVALLDVAAFSGALGVEEALSGLVDDLARGEVPSELFEPPAAPGGEGGLLGVLADPTSGVHAAWSLWMQGDEGLDEGPDGDAP